MPGGDGTGPAGMGPMTGRAAGFCAGYAAPGYAAPGYANRGAGRGFGGRGAGCGRGGRGRRNWFHATGLTGWQRADLGQPAHGGAAPQPAMNTKPAPSLDQQLDALKGQADHFEEALNGIRTRIKELEAKAKEA